MTLARKSLIMSGLIRAEDQVWKLEQLTPELRNIALSDMVYSHGQDPST